MNSYYNYTPSFGAAIAAAVLFSLGFLGTAVQLLRYKSWVWIIMLVAVGSMRFPIPQAIPSSELIRLIPFRSGGGRLYYTIHLN